MKRVRNWDIRLHEWAESVRGRPYEWGATDCGTLVREAFCVMYGEDIAADVEPYTTQRGAARVHAETGGVEFILRLLGATDIAPAFAQSGDIWIDEDGDGFPAAGVVIGRDVIWATLEDGVVRAPKRMRTGGVLLRVPHG